LEARRNCYGAHSADHPDIAKTLNNIGSCHEGSGDLAMALEFKLRALDMRKRLYKEDMMHPDLASSYTNLSLTYFSLGDHARSAEFKLKALEIKKSIHCGDDFNENH
jgi:tetratricopeptide (TPR) repeat protein